MGEDWICRILALSVLAFFYGIYFAKALSQKRRGIRTRQLGQRREKGLHRVEVLLSVATFAIVPAQLVSLALDWNGMPFPGRAAGFALALLGDVIFLFSVLCMKDSWRAGIPKEGKTHLVTAGIYAVSRNPAFLGFDLMYLGVLLLYCNPLTGALSAFAIVMLHLQILQEETYMTATFGEEYRHYRAKVCRYLGRRR